MIKYKYRDLVIVWKGADETPDALLLFTSLTFLPYFRYGKNTEYNNWRNEGEVRYINAGQHIWKFYHIKENFLNILWHLFKWISIYKLYVYYSLPAFSITAREHSKDDGIHRQAESQLTSTQSVSMSPVCLSEFVCQGWGQTYLCIS